MDPVNIWQQEPWVWFSDNLCLSLLVPSLGLNQIFGDMSSFLPLAGAFASVWLPRLLVVLESFLLAPVISHARTPVPALLGVPLSGTRRLRAGRAELMSGIPCASTSAECGHRRPSCMQEIGSPGNAGEVRYLGLGRLWKWSLKLGAGDETGRQARRCSALISWLLLWATVLESNPGPP